MCKVLVHINAKNVNISSEYLGNIESVSSIFTDDTMRKKKKEKQNKRLR